MVVCTRTGHGGEFIGPRVRHTLKNKGGQDIIIYNNRDIIITSDLSLLPIFGSQDFDGADNEILVEVGEVVAIVLLGR